MLSSKESEYKRLKPCIVAENTALSVYCIFERGLYRWIDNEGELIDAIAAATTLEEAMAYLNQWASQ